MVSSCDVFVSLESVQYTSRDWRNRNLIISRDGPQWLTIPVFHQSRQQSSIAETQIFSNGKNWRHRHLESLRHAYGKATCFDESFEILQNAYERDSSLLSDFTFRLLEDISSYLGITTQHHRHQSDIVNFSPTRRLVEICKNFGGSRYISGPSAKKYLEIDQFDEEGIEVVFFEYQDYPTYPQLWVQNFQEVSIIDLLMNKGQSSREFLGIAE